MLLKKNIRVLSATLCLLAALCVPAVAVPTVKGTLELKVEQATRGAFGIDDATGQTFRAVMEAVSCDGSVFPADGRACVNVTNFFLQIGDTSWDETMTPQGQPLIFQILFGDGSVKGLAGEITPYDPAHPDLRFFLPNSPGTWEARDLITDPQTGRSRDRGTISGTYTSQLTVVPGPAGLALFGLGLIRLLTGQRRQTAT